MVLLGGLQVVAMVLLDGCYAAARCCYGVARCCDGVTKLLLGVYFGVAIWLLRYL